MYGGIFNNYAIANFPQSVPMKIFLKSVNIWRRCGHQVNWHLFYGPRCIMFGIQVDVKKQEWQHTRSLT